jgi:hypothetical protein
MHAYIIKKYLYFIKIVLFYQASILRKKSNRKLLIIETFISQKASGFQNLSLIHKKPFIVLCIIFITASLVKASKAPL